MTGRCLTPYPTDSQHWCSRSFGHSGAHVNTTIDATWLDDTPAAVVDVPVDSETYRLINELTAENERLRQHLSASDGAEREWHSLATKGVTASAKWKTELDQLKARLAAATELTKEMLEQLVSGPERGDAEAIYEALTGELPA